jgi:short subunit dehydrogenase-like uncharacterized protein
MRDDPEFDIIVYGASGFTGRLVAKRLAERSQEAGLRWAMAGRSLDKLASVRDAIGISRDVALVVADADDPAALAAMAARTRAIITTTGPFQLYGSALVAACARGGTDYLDLSGETVWMRKMIDAHAVEAAASGARILFSCGFDSIPFELGMVFLQAVAVAELGVPASRAKGRVRRMVGRFSGGTAASGRATRAAMKRDPDVARLLADPFCLTPGFNGPPQPSIADAAYDEDLATWTAPFVMAPINTRNIHRSNALQKHLWGADFVYDEAMVAGPGTDGEARARAMAAADPLGKDARLQPGEGPTRAERDAGSFDLLFVGFSPDGRQVRIAVTGDRDPGYGSTARMVVETALCIRELGSDLPGGIWTPGAALGLNLVARLEQHAGLTFKVEQLA